MALVRVRIADRREDRDLLLGVERRDAGERRMPVQPAVLRERRAAGERELRPELAVERVALRREHGKSVGAAFEEDAHEDAAGRPVAAAAIPSSNARMPSFEPP